MRLALILTLLAGQQPAAVAVDPKTCGQYAGEYTLVRQDVLAALNDADKNLPAAEAALASAQRDLREMKAAAEELQGQKRVLLDHVARLESVLKQQQQVCEPGVAEVIERAWEWGDAPLAFAAGAGMCVGLAWGLNEVTR